MIYTDGIHIVADSLDELHEWAEHMKIKKCWYHGYRKGHPHYDCPKWFRQELLTLLRIGYIRRVRAPKLLLLSKLMITKEYIP